MQELRAGAERHSRSGRRGLAPVEAEPAPARVRVAVHVDDQLVRPGLLAELSGRDELELIHGAAADVTIVVAERVGRPVLALCESVRDGGGGSIVLVTDEPVDGILMAMARLGLMAVLRRTRLPAGRLATVAVDAAHGRAHLPADVLGTLLRGLESLQRDVLERHGLTTTGLLGREVEVLRLAAEGLPNAAIADRLGCSERTVKHVVNRLLARLGAGNRSHAVATAIQHGLI